MTENELISLASSLSAICFFYWIIWINILIYSYQKTNPNKRLPVPILISTIVFGVLLFITQVIHLLLLR